MPARHLRRAWLPAALAGLAVLLTGCDSAAPALACKVDVTSPDLVADREAAGVADCTEIATIDRGPDGGEAVPADLPDLALDCLGGTSTVSLADVRGPAMINFWASNCGPCRDELPALQEFHERFGDRVAVFGVDYLETYPAAAVDLFRLTGVTYPSLADACGDLADEGLAIYGLPHFVFVDADGTVSQVPGGKDDLAEIVAMAEAQLGLDLEGEPAGGAR